MIFTNRIKKEMSEGLVKALLIDAGYRVISSGVENIIRETECLSENDFKALGFSKAITSMPDYIIMNKDQTEMHIVDVKYRANWSTKIFNEVEYQVRLMGKLTLICFNANPPKTDSTPSAGTYLRCCELKYTNGKYLINKYQSGGFEWVEVNVLIQNEEPWYRLAPVQKVFHNLQTRYDSSTTDKAVRAMSSIFENF